MNITVYIYYASKEASAKENEETQSLSLNSVKSNAKLTLSASTPKQSKIFGFWFYVNTSKSYVLLVSSCNASSTIDSIKQKKKH